MTQETNSPCIHTLQDRLDKLVKQRHVLLDALKAYPSDDKYWNHVAKPAIECIESERL